MFESAAVIGRGSKVLKWHVPRGVTSVSIPDSRDLWDVIWENRRRLVGVAHTHPGSGALGPSREDVTTFSAVEIALGRKLKWWISNATKTVACVWIGPGKYDYAVDVVDAEPGWVCKLRTNSRMQP